MLRYLARLGPVVMRARCVRLDPPVSILHRRVRLGEIDTNLHMNQAVFPQVFELGRAHWMVGTRAFSAWRGRAMNPMLARQELTYRRELKPWQRYTIESRAVGVEGRFLVMQGVLHVEDRVHALAEVRILFAGREGVADAGTVRAASEGLLTERLQIRDWVVSR